MITLGVDLAARFSAGCVTDSGQVLFEFGSADDTAFSFAEKIMRTAVDYHVDRTILEDVPPGVKFGLKPIYRLQGLVMHALAHDGLDSTGLLDRTLFVQPRPWQNFYPGVARGAEAERIEAARVAAEKIGYAPPPLVDEYIATVPEGKRPLVKYLKPLAKQMTDYIDARLICDWADQFDSLEAIEAKYKNMVQRPYI
jgi:hypothetical protein